MRVLPPDLPGLSVLRFASSLPRGTLVLHAAVDRNPSYLGVEGKWKAGLRPCQGGFLGM